jgi:para-aminobenzoate synthetase/4-amino-4-deoxychorismate lyase
VRVVVTESGELSLAGAPAPIPRPTSVARVVRGRSGLWRHKWAERSYLAAAEAGAAVPLFVADDGTVLETSRGNVFLLRADGSLVTPPLRDDLLPGVTRRAVLDLARDAGRSTELRPFGLAELRRTAAFWTSSLSGAVAIHAVDGAALPRRDDEISALAALLGSRRHPG